MKIKITDIIIPEGRRAINHDKVASLAESIKMIGGLIHPITIDKDRTLIAGAHRVEAYKKLGFDEIECVEFDGERLEAELVEIDENLMRNELDDITVGELAVRRDEILEELGLRAKVGQGRPLKNGAGDAPLNTDGKNGAGDAPLRTTADIAREVGMSERTLQENKQLAKNLIPEAKEARREKRITKDTALVMTRLTPEQQREALEKCEKDENARLGKDGKIRPAKYKPRKKTVAKTDASESAVEADDQEDFGVLYEKWQLDMQRMIRGEIDDAPTPIPTQNLLDKGILKFPLPVDRYTAFATFAEVFRSEPEEIRNRVITEMRLLADDLDNLND